MSPDLTGRVPGSRGEASPHAKLAAGRVRELRLAALEEGRTLTGAAAAHGATASQVVRGLRRGHIGGARAPLQDICVA